MHNQISTNIQIIEDLIDDNYKYLENQKEKELAVRNRRKSESNNVEVKIKNATKEFQYKIIGLNSKIDQREIEVSDLKNLLERVRIKSSLLLEITKLSNESQLPITTQQLSDVTMLHVTALDNNKDCVDVDIEKYNIKPERRPKWLIDPLA